MSMHARVSRCERECTFEILTEVKSKNLIVHWTKQDKHCDMAQRSMEDTGHSPNKVLRTVKTDQDKSDPGQKILDKRRNLVHSTEECRGQSDGPRGTKKILIEDNERVLQVHVQHSGASNEWTDGQETIMVLMKRNVDIPKKLTYTSMQCQRIGKVSEKKSCPD